MKAHVIFCNRTGQVRLVENNANSQTVTPFESVSELLNYADEHDIDIELKDCKTI